MNNYEFNLDGWKLFGKGETKKEAWKDAVEALLETHRECMPDAKEIIKIPRDEGAVEKNENISKQPIFEILAKLLKDKKFIEQHCGNIYANGEYATNFFSKDESTVVHISVGVCPDEEVIERLKGVE